MVTLREVAAALGTAIFRPYGWTLGDGGAPHTGTGYRVVFDAAALIAWCKGNADASRNAGDAETAARWQDAVDRLQAALPAWSALTWPRPVTGRGRTAALSAA